MGAQWSGRMRLGRPVVVVVLAAVVLVGGLSTVAQAQSSGSACADLVDLELAEVVAITAELDSDGEAAGQTGLPEFCRVALTVSPQVNIEVWLPAQTWNERFQGVGGGGYAGSISFGGMADALRDGYATASTDTGHSSGGGGFALNPDGTLNWQLIEDFASRSLFEMTTKAQDLVQAYYGQQERYSYWNGCSTGGRQGLMHAQRLPDAYDGILAGAPAIHWDRFHPAHLWPQVVREEEVGETIPQCKYEAAVAAAVEACDDLDGVTDGILEDPTLCTWDPVELVGEELPCGTFTAADARVVRLTWDGPRDTDGTRLWYGLPRGADTGALAGPSPFFIGLQHAQYWVNQDPDWDWTTLTYDTYGDYFQTSVDKFNDVIGTDDPDLSAFRDSGGKVLMWHGWSDQLIFAQGSVDYYERVVDTLGDDVDEFARLFMAPGVAHCGGGPGPGEFDMFAELVNWVESGQAPERIIASEVDDGEVVKTRPLCPYPSVARYDGTGDPNDAASFACAATLTNAGRQNVAATVPDDPDSGEFLWSISGDGNVDLGDMADQGTHLRATGPIDPILVTDTRTGGPAWSISGQVGDFDPGGLGGNHLGWTPKVLIEGAGATAGDAVASGIDGGDGLSVAATMASAEAGHASGTGRVGADLDLRFPAETNPGQYRATLTITALS